MAEDIPTMERRLNCMLLALHHLRGVLEAGAGILDDNFIAEVSHRLARLSAETRILENRIEDLEDDKPSAG